MTDPILIFSLVVVFSFPFFLGLCCWLLAYLLSCRKRLHNEENIPLKPVPACSQSPSAATGIGPVIS